MKLIELLKKIAEATEVIVNESGYEIARYDKKDSMPNGLNNREVYEVREEDGAIVVELVDAWGQSVGEHLEEYDIDEEIIIKGTKGGTYKTLYTGEAVDVPTSLRRREIGDTRTEGGKLVISIIGEA